MQEDTREQLLESATGLRYHGLRKEICYAAYIITEYLERCGAVDRIIAGELCHKQDAFLYGGGVV